MNQALAFGLLLAGGVALEAGLTGKGPGAVLKGTAGKIPTTGSQLQITADNTPGAASTANAVSAGVGGVGSTIAGFLGGTGQKAVITDAGAVLVAAGLTPIAAAGVLGNANQESGFNPSSVGDGGGGLWGFTSGAISLASLQAWASSKGLKWDDAATQAQFLVLHLSSSDIAALNQQTTPAAAAVWFQNNWERPAVATENQANRIAGANIAYKVLAA